MQLTTLARVLTITDTAALAGATGLSQAAYDLPAGRARWVRWVAVGAGGVAVTSAGDVLWWAATRDRPEPLDDRPVSPAHLSTYLLGVSGVSLAGAALWWAARGLPADLRRRGVARPNHLLAWPVGLGSAAALVGTVRSYHHDRAADVLRRERVPR